MAGLRVHHLQWLVQEQVLALVPVLVPVQVLEQLELAPVLELVPVQVLEQLELALERLVGSVE